MKTKKIGQQAEASDSFSGNRSTLKFVLTIVVLSVAFLVGFCMYIWQANAYETRERLINDRIKALEKQIHLLQEQKEDAENTTPSTGDGETGSNGAIVSEEQIVAGVAEKAVKAFASRDTKTISELAHPAKGIRFSPYSSVNTTTDITLKSADLLSAGTSTKIYTWGSYDGSGAPIALTYTEYVKKFVTDKDYLAKSDVSYDKTLAKGNTIDNAATVYPNGHIIEYYSAPTTQDGLDWSALRLAFEKDGDNWYIVGVIHNQWTI